MFTIKSSETLNLTANVIQKYLDMDASPTERTIDAKRIKHLREKADNKLLTPFNWACAEVDGKIYRMNGQHSSNMLSQMSKEGELPDGLIAHIDVYSVDSVEGLALLFRQFDDRKSSRSPLDVSGAYQGLHKDLHDVPKASAKIAVEGINWYRHSIEGHATKSGDDAYDLFNVESMHPFITYMGALITSKTRELKKVQVASGIYATYSANEKVSEEFWTHVAKGGMEFEDQNPTTILSEWLVKAFDKTHRKPPKPAEYYNACVYAWNAYRAARTITMINIKSIKNDLIADS